MECYLRALCALDLDGMHEVKVLEQLQEEISLPEYLGLKVYDEWLAWNIDGVCRTLTDMSYANQRRD